MIDRILTALGGALWPGGESTRSRAAYEQAVEVFFAGGSASAFWKGRIALYAALRASTNVAPLTVFNYSRAGSSPMNSIHGIAWGCPMEMRLRRAGHVTRRLNKRWERLDINDRRRDQQ